MSEQIDIILASASPRRRELLEQAGLHFRVIDSHADEAIDDQTWNDPATAVQVLAERKAATVIQTLIAAPETIRRPTMVIGADTVVTLDGKVFGKPVSADDAHRMLRTMSGRGHQVITGVSVWAVAVNADGNVTVGHANFAETSDVYFKDLTEDDIAAYIAEGESFDKAGAYAIQGKGERLVDHYEGDYDNIVGLPVGPLLDRFPQIAEQIDAL